MMTASDDDVRMIMREKGERERKSESNMSQT
jgi:hypothetical protein